MPIIDIYGLIPQTLELKIAKKTQKAFFFDSKIFSFFCDTEIWTFFMERPFLTGFVMAPVSY